LANEVTTAPAAPVSQEAPHLRRVLGRWDLVLLFVVAIVNLNVVPTIAANGGVTVWLWLLALLLFFWPQGIAVIELAHRLSGEGGVILWRNGIRRLPRFLSGWWLLDEQHFLTADGSSLFRWHFGLRRGSARPHACRQSLVRARRIDGASRPSCCPECTRPGRPAGGSITWRDRYRDHCGHAHWPRDSRAFRFGTTMTAADFEFLATFA